MTRPSYLLALGSRAFQLAVGLVAALVVRFFWVSHFGDGIMSGSFALTAPLLGFIKTPSFVGSLVMASGVGTLVVGVLRRDLGWAASGLLVMSLGSVVYDTPVNAVRAAGMLPVLWAFGPRLARIRPASRGSWDAVGRSYAEG